MTRHSSTLHGSAPDKSPLALLVIDMINDLEFQGGERLLRAALPVARRIAAMKRRVRAAGVPVIYANDNFGRWRSDFRQAVNHCLRGGVRGRPLAETLVPGPDDYFVLKPKHSAFFSTNLATMLDYLGARRLILTGISGDTCVLATAIDAHMRDFDLNAPRDCIASIDPKHNTAALAYMKRVLDADTRPSTGLSPGRLAKRNR